MTAEATQKPDTSQDQKKEVLRHQVRRAILDMILRKELPPGQRIAQERIAKQLKVSRGVVRETLLALQSTYLVELVDHKGAYVGRLDPEKMEEIYVAREAIECMVVRLCCLRVNRLQVEELRQLVVREKACEAEGDLMAAARMDRRFHGLLLERSGNRILGKIMEEHLVLTKIFRTIVTNPAATSADHLAIISAIEHNDPEEAESIMRRHIRTGLDHALQQLATESDDLSLIPIDDAGLEHVEAPA